MAEQDDPIRVNQTTERSDPLWGAIFNAIPPELRAGSEQKLLLFSQRAQIADAVFAALKEQPHA